MSNFYKYSFLFIMNLSLAQKIDSCSIFNIPGIYTLDKISIDDNVYHISWQAKTEPVVKE